MATGSSGFDTVEVKLSIHIVGEGMVGLSDVKSITLIILELVD